MAVLLSHGVDDRLLIVGVNVPEQNGVPDQGENEQPSLLRLADLLGGKNALFVEGSEDLLGDSHSTLLLARQHLSLFDDLQVSDGVVLFVRALAITAVVGSFGFFLPVL